MIFPFIPHCFSSHQSALSRFRVPIQKDIFKKSFRASVPTLITRLFTITYLH